MLYQLPAFAFLVVCRTEPAENKQPGYPLHGLSWGIAPNYLGEAWEAEEK